MTQEDMTRDDTRRIIYRTLMANMPDFDDPEEVLHPKEIQLLWEPAYDPVDVYALIEKPMTQYFDYRERISLDTDEMISKIIVEPGRYPGETRLELITIGLRE